MGRYGWLGAAVVGIVVLVAMPLSADAGDSVPTRTCFGMVPTMVGTPGSDSLSGTEGQTDVLLGMGGNDVLGGVDSYGDTVPDYFCGGRGNDHFWGDNAPNFMRGGAGNDYVKAWRGDDLVFGGAGDDRLGECDNEAWGIKVFHGGPGNDSGCVIDGEFHGGGGDDRIAATRCGARLYGGPGNDSFSAWYQQDWWGYQEPGPCDELYPVGHISVTILGRGGDDFAVTGLANQDVVHVETHTFCSTLSDCPYTIYGWPIAAR
jgi:Ca2+-binding RTX toxin-like protein